MEEKIQQIPVLRSVYGGLTKSERRIADYIANHIGVVMEQDRRRLGGADREFGNHDFPIL